MPEKNKLLLHICCAGCGAYVSQLLKESYDVVLFFYNPSISPQSEYNARRKEVKIVAEKFNLQVIIPNYDHGKWLDIVRGFEKEPEKGKRCMICYQDRLENAARFAQQNVFNYFTSTLTVSPHKIASKIVLIGQELEEKYNIKFLAQDFKKQDGFKKATGLSKELGLYRQDYCGCEFSKR